MCANFEVFERTYMYQGFMQDFFAGGGGGWRLFLDSKQMCAKQTACKPHPSRGGLGVSPPPPQKH